MSERIDHVEQAKSIAEVAATKLSANWESETGERKADMLAVAQLHATLALVEQQRIGNLLKLGLGTEATASALYVDPPGHWDFDKPRTLRPEIAAALGLTAGQEGVTL